MKQSIGQFPASWEIGKGGQHTVDYFGSIRKFSFSILTLSLRHIGKNCCKGIILHSDKVIGFTLAAAIYSTFFKKLTVMIGWMDFGNHF